MDMTEALKTMEERRATKRKARITELPEATFGPGKTVEILGPIGLIRLSVCTNVDPEKVGAAANYVAPTGISSGWERCPEPNFATGQTNPCPCPDGNGCHHYLLGC